MKKLYSAIFLCLLFTSVTSNGASPVVISEFLASNTLGLRDETGNRSDWIEIRNISASAVNLLDWSLTDDPGNLTMWRFPSTNLNAGAFMVVYASGRNLRVAGAPLHTSFVLHAGGDYLALVYPDGTNIATQFTPTYLPQVPNVSYGFGLSTSNLTLLKTNSAVRVRIPTDGSEGTAWTTNSFDDSAWMAGTNGVGFGPTGAGAPADYGAAVLPTAPVAYWRLNETGGTAAANLGSGAGLDGVYGGSPVLGGAGPRPPAFNGFETDNRAPAFNGTSSYVTTPTPLLNGQSSFTMAGWIRPAAAQAARTGLFGQNDCVEFGFISASGLQLWTFVGQIDFAYPFAFGEWHHIAAIGSGSQLQLYLDGTLRASATMSGPIGTSAFNFNIGGNGIFDGTGNFFNGQMDEVAAYHRALSAAEVLSLFQAGTNGAGATARSFVVTDVAAAMSNVNASAYLRLPFVINEPTNISVLNLRLRYDDGFAAWINGTLVAKDNASENLLFNSNATNSHSPAFARDLTIGNSGFLQAGTNILAIQGLNAAAADVDFLIVAELSATAVLAEGTLPGYFTQPTPGAINSGGSSTPGPIISDAGHTPNVPLDFQDLAVTARVEQSLLPVTNVTMIYRIMFNTPLSAEMFDDGLHSDGAAGDGIFGAIIPASASTNGQMIRYYVRALDSQSHTSRWPQFLDVTNSPEYLGTIVNPTNVASLLPIFHLFAPATVLDPDPPTSQVGADGEGGGRVSVFYDGEFYDNIYMEIRGNTSAGQQKKSHRLEFNREHKFRHLSGFPRVQKTSFMAEFLDPAYIRQHLSFWLLDQMGVKTPFFYPVRAQLNGSFYALVFHSDVIDLEQVERMGYDPLGALYKAAGNVLPSRSSTGVFQKKSEPLNDDSDYQVLVRAINETNTPPGQPTNLAQRRAAAYDMLDIPEVINYLAGARWCAENDDVWANMSIYRDTTNGNGDGLWRIIPFDMNASWGQRYGGITPLDAIADSCKSHPLYGGSTTIACDGSSYNRMYDIIIALPETRQMLLRRQRTVLDRWVLEPGVPAESRLLETHIRYMTNLIWTEAALDRAKWQYSTWTASNKPLGTAIPELFNEFINLRRIHWNGTHNVTNVAKPIGINKTDNAGIPLSQPLQPNLGIAAIEFSPSSGNQLQEYLCVTNPNPYAVDITGWKLGNGVNFTFHPGTVIPSNSVLYVSPHLPAFRTRTTGPRGGQGLFVVGPYKGQLSARGEALTLHDDRGRLVYTNSYPGSPSLAQQFLRVSEVMYNPPPLAGNTNEPQQFEYIELKNISPSVTLDLNGVRFINAVRFNFTGSAVTSLAPGQRALVVRNTATFAARYGGGLPVAGQYVGSLESNGERIQLVDAVGEEILDFAYNNSWYPITDGLGFSLVVVNENALPDAWDSKGNWRPSGSLYGAPGQVDTELPYLPPVLITEVLTHTDPPLLDTVELWNPTTNDVNLGGWFISDDFITPQKFRIPNGTMITAGGYLIFDETVFTNAATALIPFAFSGTGDEVWLFSGDANANLTGYAFGENFGAAANGVSFGRYTNSAGKVHFVAQTANTLGAPNAGPRTGPVVLSEIMYHPPDLADGSDNSADEFIELRNISPGTVDLFNPNQPSDTWHLRGGADFTLPPGVTLASGATLLVVNFDPTDLLSVTAFRAKHGFSPSLPIYGPYSGKLGNDADDVKLERPDEPVLGVAPYILVDRVEYEDGNGWPAAADGSGSSLQRLAPSAYGNQPISWVGAAPSAGGDYPGGTPPVITVQPVSQTALATLSAMFSVTASGPAPLRYQWRLAGVSVSGATNAILALNNLQVTQGGEYSVVVFNGAGAAVSSNATLTVNVPALFYSQPASIAMRGSTNAADYGNATNNATFSAFATGTGVVRYQWRYNGMEIPGATNTMLTVTNVQVANEGTYDVLVTDVIGTIPSAPARLSVLLTPIILQAPLAQTVPAGSLVTVSVAISGSPAPFTYQWRSNSLTIASVASNARTNFVSFLAPTNAVNTTYRVVITNAAHVSPGITTTFVITTIADADRDGIPDAMEISLGLNPNDPADAGGDLDGDGMTNLAEYRAGTNPNDAGSYLRIDIASTPGTAGLRFAAVSNRTYTVQYTDQLPSAGPWTKLADFVARTTNRVEVINDAGWTTNRFYRVALPSQP